jgi:hypothetical protein
MDELFRSVIEEIALEGLEGTTINHLWELLKNERNIELDADVCRGRSRLNASF